jgi:hypothetical protein
MNDIAAILKTKPQTNQEDEMLTIVTMVRPSKTKDKFEIALGVTNKWLELPISQVKSAQEIGVYQIGEDSYKVAELNIIRPKTDNVWFDFLSHVLQELGYSLQNNECGCSHGDPTSPPPRARYRLITGRSIYWRLACMYNGYSIRWCSQNGM